MTKSAGKMILTQQVFSIGTSKERVSQTVVYSYTTLVSNKDIEFDVKEAGIVIPVKDTDALVPIIQPLESWVVTMNPPLALVLIGLLKLLIVTVTFDEVSLKLSPALVFVKVYDTEIYKEAILKVQEAI